MIWPFKQKKSHQDWHFRIECPECGHFHDYADSAFSELVQTSCQEMDKRVAQIQEHAPYAQGTGTWHYDEDKNKIWFSFPSGQTFHAPIQYVGSWFEPRTEFLWAWANNGMKAQFRKRTEQVYSFGTKNSFLPLTSNRVATDLNGAWLLAKTACLLSGYHGLYAAPVSEDLHLFFAFDDLHEEASA